MLLPILYNPSPACRRATHPIEDLSVQSLLLTGHFLNIFEKKNTILNKHPVAREKTKCVQTFPNSAVWYHKAMSLLIFEIVTSLLPLMSVYQNFLKGRKVTLSCHFYNLKVTRNFKKVSLWKHSLTWSGIFRYLPKK